MATKKLTEEEKNKNKAERMARKSAEASTHWGTESEIAFIDGLGTHTTESRRITMPRVALLEGYIKSCDKRVRWGKIDSQKVLIHACAALKREEI